MYLYMTSHKGSKTRVVRKVRGQSYLRQNYCVLCRKANVLLNDYQLKIKLQKSYEFEVVFKRTIVIDKAQKSSQLNHIRTKSILAKRKYYAH